VANEEGGKTILATLKPTTLLAMFNAPQLKDMSLHSNRPAGFSPWAASEAAQGENPHWTLDSDRLFLVSTPLDGYGCVRREKGNSYQLIPCLTFLHLYPLICSHNFLTNANN
jgi:hypothetical protein